MQDLQTNACVLRIFSGPLRGCEFTLERPVTLFLVGPQAVFCANEKLPTVPADAIYIPLEQGSCNFEVLLADNSRQGCVIRQLAEDIQEHQVNFQTLTAVGALYVAIRNADDVWDESLLLDRDVRPATQAHSPLQKLQSMHWPTWATVAVASLAVIILAGTGYALRATPVSDIRELIAGGTGDLRVVSGQGRSIYVIAAGERDANWARQVMMRNGHDAGQVRITYDERIRLQRVLAEHYPLLVYHRIDLSDLTAPQLWVSSQRNVLTPKMQRELETLLLSQVPYAKQVHIKPSDDRELVRAAEQGLARLAIPYERLNKADFVTFIVQGSLQDAELLAVRDYVNEYYRLWGDRYVHFAIELKDDWLKGKSFQYGPQGYVKMAASSWYFPKPL